MKKPPQFLAGAFQLPTGLGGPSAAMLVRGCPTEGIAHHRAQLPSSKCNSHATPSTREIDFINNPLTGKTL